MADLKLYYTGSEEPLEPQEDPLKSIGGYVSITEFNEGLNTLFGDISINEFIEGKRDYRSLVIVNSNTVNDINNIKIYYKNNSTKPSVNLKMGAASLQENDCGLFLQKLSDDREKPNDVSFRNNKTELQALKIDQIKAGEAIGLWIERHSPKSSYKKIFNCDSLYNEFSKELEKAALEITSSADVAGSLSGTYFILEHGQNKYLFYLNDGNSDYNLELNVDEIIEVFYNQNDDANTIAAELKEAFDLFLGDLEITKTELVNNVLKIDFLTDGDLSLSDDTTPFTFNILNAGGFKIDLEEDFEIIISY